MARPTMTAEAFEALQPRLSHLTLSTIEITREVLVEGKSQSEVARVRAAAKEIERGWRKVEVWLPPEMAEQVRKMEAEARAQLAREK
ncbi:hypothetical protein CAP48_19500 (plasmid) [Advenella sp. S44]|uniref:TrfB-related DNA-binding protein n=1 Tax=Advenella sp. S44 TaxID=1982755 RepID=UPI000C2A5290|nr:TrfB-related DNA-binding protein [Advenella sp. S44]PJX19990.1 hypothetical protein CAP48_19500 [Advenella sp. S44]